MDTESFAITIRYLGQTRRILALPEATENAPARWSAFRQEVDGLAAREMDAAAFFDAAASALRKHGFSQIRE